MEVEGGELRSREVDLTRATASGEGEGASGIEVHWLPCRIDHDGEARGIETYFRSSVREAGEEEAPQHKEAYLRGRHLKGAELPLPDGYAAVVLEKHEVGGWTDLDKSHASWRAAGACGPITYWNHTTNPGRPTCRGGRWTSFLSSRASCDDAGRGVCFGFGWPRPARQQQQQQLL